MKYTIKSLDDQMIIAKNSGRMDFRELFETEDIWAVSYCNTTFEFDDKIQKSITFIHEDANGQKLEKEFELPSEVTYQTVLDKIRPMFDGE